MINIRPMNSDDIEAVAAIEADNFSVPWSAKAFCDALNLESSLFLVAEGDSGIAGYAGMSVALDEGEITQVAVARKFRRCGIGGKLLDEIIAEAVRKDLSQIVLEVRVTNTPAISMYEKKGFASCGVRKGFYDLPKEDAYIMIMQIQGRDKC